MAELHDPYGALRVPDFRRLLTCSVFASVASEIQAVAVGWELYQRTNSKAALGFVGLVQFLPVLLLSLPAGHAADRRPRGRTQPAAGQNALVGIGHRLTAEAH